MFLIIELQTATLDYGIRGISAGEMWLVFAMTFAIPMIPYLLLYRSLAGKRAAAGSKREMMPLKKLGAWIGAHRHPELLHHH
jgi:hypothetical protein